MTEQHKRKIGLANSISMRGKKQSEETINKRRLKNIGKKRTPEQLETMSKVRKSNAEFYRSNAIRNGLGGKWFIGE